MKTDGITVWLTGLPSAGKSTISKAAAERLKSLGRRVEILDGDVVRGTLCKDLGFSRSDREENLRRLSFVAELLARNGIIVLVAAISPYRQIRDQIRQSSVNFIEVYVNAPLAVCERRDVKGLYRRARSGELKGLTGVDDVYEIPASPDVECRTDHETLAQSVDKLMGCIENYTNRLRLEANAARVGVFTSAVGSRRNQT